MNCCLIKLSFLNLFPPELITRGSIDWLITYLYTELRTRTPGEMIAVVQIQEDLSSGGDDHAYISMTGSWSKFGHELWIYQEARS